MIFPSKTGAALLLHPANIGVAKDLPSPDHASILYCSDGIIRLPVLLTTIGRSFRNMAETLRNVGGTSGAEQLDP